MKPVYYTRSDAAKATGIATATVYVIVEREGLGQAQTASGAPLLTREEVDRIPELARSVGRPPTKKPAKAKPKRPRRR